MAKTVSDRLRRKKKKGKKGKSVKREFDGKEEEGVITGERDRLGGGEVVKEEYHDGDTKIKTKTDEEGKMESQTTNMKNINPASVLERLMAKRVVTKEDETDPETGELIKRKTVEKINRKTGRRIRAKVKRKRKKS